MFLGSPFTPDPLFHHSRLNVAPMYFQIYMYTMNDTYLRNRVLKKMKSSINKISAWKKPNQNKTEKKSPFIYDIRSTFSFTLSGFLICKFWTFIAEIEIFLLDFFKGNKIAFIVPFKCLAKSMLRQIHLFK